MKKVKVIKNPTSIRYRAKHNETGETCWVSLIDFNNKYVEVLPDGNLEGGNCEYWDFDKILLLEILE